MASDRSISLRVWLGKHGATYALTHRTNRDGRTVDGRLDHGTLRYAAASGVPQDVLAVLRRALEDLEARHGVSPAPAQRSAPPGGPRGRNHDGADVPLFPVRPERGQGLDRPLPGL